MTTNFAMVCGDHLTITIDIADEDGADLDVSDAQAMTWGMGHDVNNVLVTKTMADGITVSAHHVYVALVPADTEDVSPGTYRHELEITDVDGRTYTALQGWVTLEGDIV